MDCKGLCLDACGPIHASEHERARLHPRLKLHRRGDGNILFDLLFNKPCPALRDKRCSVYSDRPLICRLYGATEVLRCPHGCEPERLLTRDEAAALLREADELTPRSP